jgi:hypothetical protein
MYLERGEPFIYTTNDWRNQEGALNGGSLRKSRLLRGAQSKGEG